ncbi:helix-turn-helix domain-containing protein [Alphaproteobacteria bacterium GH1-50]|uniref:Helix-turn-helix domain-containing protein n=1 Tax=Kangsaoukella pontilimi TaxID=2691042 RepID=A0A7C9II94_9RHOB|nr:sugar-binding transcriptional regulator [Kangsaoukella pontilimi]MXQ09209.1 helix-turn-helix domain-containing protein [Kangsaoukella pontilimi]
MPDGRSILKDGSASEATLAHVAMLYYREGLTQGEIARRTGVSRATIVNWLRLAREQNVVDIRIRGESFAASPLARHVAERFGLVDVYVAHGDADPLPPSAMLDRTAALGAQAMRDLLDDGDRLGVAWGETVLRMAKTFPTAQLPGLMVHQLIGSMYADQLFAAETCTIEIARRLGAGCRTLHAPAILSSGDLAARLRKEPVIAGQLAAFSGLTKALFSVGDVSDRTTLVAAGIGTTEDVAWYRERGAAGVLSCHFIDHDGQPMTGPLTDRTIGVAPEVLRNVPLRMLVVSGEEKLDATRALIRGGFVTHLVTDEASARILLDS